MDEEMAKKGARIVAMARQNVQWFDDILARLREGQRQSAEYKQDVLRRASASPKGSADEQKFTDGAQTFAQCEAFTADQIAKMEQMRERAKKRLAALIERFGDTQENGCMPES